MRLGCHVSISKGLIGAAREAAGYGANAFMIYTGAPQNTVRKAIDKMGIAEGREFMKEAGIDMDSVVVHAPYIINPGSPDPAMRELAASVLQNELDRTEAIGAAYFVLHPGSNPDRAEGLRLAAETVSKAMRPGIGVTVCYEIMAGRGNELGKTFEELRELVERTDQNNMTGVCFDTCHAFAAGFDIVNGLNGVFDDFDRVVGLPKIKVVHVNGSLHPLGSRKDRHANIGAGTDNPKGIDCIGFKAISNVVYSSRLNDPVFILETPWPDDEHNLYKEEIALLRRNK